MTIFDFISHPSPRVCFNMLFCSTAPFTAQSHLDLETGHHKHSPPLLTTEQQQQELSALLNWSSVVVVYQKLHTEN